MSTPLNFPVIAALIGASSALIGVLVGHVLQHIFTDSREKSRQITEARRLAYIELSVAISPFEVEYISQISAPGSTRLERTVVIEATNKALAALIKVELLASAQVLDALWSLKNELMTDEIMSYDETEAETYLEQLKRVLEAWRLVYKSMRKELRLQ